MNVQEREEHEYSAGLQTEHQNAFELSRREHAEKEAGRRERTDGLLAKGFYVVVVMTDAYCPFTDAPVGQNEQFISASKSYETAKRRADKLNDDPRLGEECYATILQPGS